MPNWLKKLYALVEKWFYSDGSLLEYLLFVIMCLLFTLWLLNRPPFHLGWLIGY